ncbi:MAG: hypothetical protein ACOCXO_07395 [Bacteroidota bacterium]
MSDTLKLHTMKKLVFLISCFLISAPGVKAQQNTWVQANAGIGADQYHLVDPGGHMKTGIPTFAYEFSISQEIVPDLHLETGLLMHEYYSGEFFKESFGGSFSNTLMSLQIPIRLKYEINLLNEKLVLSPSLGYKPGINLDYYPHPVDHEEPDGAGSGGMTGMNDNIRYEYSSETHNNYRRFFHMPEMGLSLEYKTDYDVKFSFIARYTGGFNKIIEHHTWYSYNDGEEHHAIQTSKGEYTYFGFGVGWKLSNLWQNAETRREARPERLEKLSEAVDYPFYAGLEAASQTNASHSQGDVSGSSMYLPVFMAFTDFKSGMFFGHNINDFMGIETGIYHQFYNSSYTIHNDIDASFGMGSNSVVNFMQIPLRVHYRQLLFKNRMEIKPYIGLGMVFSNKPKGPADTETRYQGDSLIIDMEQGNIYYNDTTSRTITTETIENPMGVQILAGLNIEYALSPRISFLAACRFSYGLQDLYRLDVLYVSDNETSSGSTSYQGTGLALSAGLKYRFGKD